MLLLCPFCIITKEINKCKMILHIKKKKYIKVKVEKKIFIDCFIILLATYEHK